MSEIGDTLYTSPHGRSERIGDESAEITGETKFSWLMGDSKYKREKVNKKTMLESVAGYGARRWYTAQDLTDESWRRKYRHVISGVVQAERDVKKLRQIAEILDMKVDQS
jgi:hypothetical protein